MCKDFYFQDSIDHFTVPPNYVRPVTLLVTQLVAGISQKRVPQ